MFDDCVMSIVVDYIMLYSLNYLTLFLSLSCRGLLVIDVLVGVACFVYFVVPSFH